VTKTESLNGQLSRVIFELVLRGVPLEAARREFERQFIMASLRSSEGNLSRAAKSLGVHRNTLRNKVATLGIDVAERGQKSAYRRAPRP
jgi:DNA-binding NtrC family response regulator